MTWDGIVTNFHNCYAKVISISDQVEAYIQSIVLQKTLESISFDQRSGFDEDEAAEISSAELSAGRMQRECQNTIQRQN
ncbi:unnamed protein product [Thelazia callipaeda]|uniref:Reverse transcriptase n=1 Tax=Thelazia callipaeda TaxID=103827 RepID=A0A0N5CQT6_THECL|nr:unnamed protein product [Thelazia callipaeda]